MLGRYIKVQCAHRILESGIAKPNDELMMISHEGKFKGPIAACFKRKQQAAVIQLPAEIGTED